MAEHIVTLVVSTDEASDPREWDWVGRLGASEVRVLAASALPTRLTLPPLTPLLHGSALDDEASAGLALTEDVSYADWSEPGAEDGSSTTVGVSDEWMTAGSGWEGITDAPLQPAEPTEDGEGGISLAESPADEDDAQGSREELTAAEDDLREGEAIALGPDLEESPSAEDAFLLDPTDLRPEDAAPLEGDALGESEDALAVAYEFPEAELETDSASGAADLFPVDEASALAEDDAAEDSAPSDVPAELISAEDTSSEEGLQEDVSGDEPSEDGADSAGGWSGFGEEMAALAATPEPEATGPVEELLSPDERKSRAYQLFEQLWIEVCQKADPSHMVLLSQFTELTPEQMLKRLSGSLDAAGNVPSPIDGAHARAVAAEIRRLDPDNYGPE